MPGLVISMTLGAGPAQSPRRRAGAMAGANSSCSPISANHRSLSVRRIDEIFAIEREINGLAAEQRLAVRRKRVTPLVDDLKAWMLTERARLSRHADIAKAMDYMLKRWPAFTRFLDDGRICLSNNAAERALRGVALGRRAWLFAGSDRGGERAAAMYTLIATAKLNGIDPPGLARRRAASHCRSCDFPARRAAALAVEATRNPRRCRLSPHHGLGRMVTPVLPFHRFSGSHWPDPSAVCTRRWSPAHRRP